MFSQYLCLSFRKTKSQFRRLRRHFMQFRDACNIYKQGFCCCQDGNVNSLDCFFTYFYIVFVIVKTIQILVVIKVFHFQQKTLSDCYKGIPFPTVDFFAIALFVFHYFSLLNGKPYCLCSFSFPSLRSSVFNERPHVIALLLRSSAFNGGPFCYCYVFFFHY